MSKTGVQKLSFFPALLVTINTMFGSGIFINTVYLSKTAGILGFLSYSIVALILLPLILVMSTLVRRHPEGGFYQYTTHSLGSFWGFVSTWIYAIGKLASATLLIHVFSTLMQTIIPPLKLINPFTIDGIVLFVFMCITYFGIKLGSHVNIAFFILKVSPVLFVIFSCLYFANSWHIDPASFLWFQVPGTIPIVLYAFLGFEAACSISIMMEDSHKNASRIIWSAFAFSLSITILYQFLLYLTVGNALAQQSSFLQLFPTFFQQLWPTFAYKEFFVAIMHIATACAALGGSFGMIFGNVWNIFILAKHGHLFFSKFLLRPNTFHVPFACFIIQAVICIFYFWLTKAQTIPLQQLSVFGISCALLLSVISLLVLNKNTKSRFSTYIIPYSALASCLLLLTVCLQNMINSQLIEPFLGFAFLFAFGLFMYFMQQRKTISTSL